MSKNRALIVIDVQNEYFYGKLKVTYPLDSLDNILKAIKVAKEKNIPIIFIQHTSLQNNQHTFLKGSYEWQLHDKIRVIEPHLYIEKNYPSAFYKTKLNSYLKEHNIDTIAISGYATQVCCDTTARYGFHLGYNIEFLSDATATLDLQTDLGKIDAKTLFDSTLATQSTIFSKVLNTNSWIKSI